MGKKYIDEKWDFRYVNTKVHSHGFHNYPAIMIPQIAGALIDKYGCNANLLLDPYCGTGTSLVEACLRGITSIGSDLNPLARLISKSKTTIVNVENFGKLIEDYQNKTFNIAFGKTKLNGLNLPDYKNIDYWFDEQVQVKLAYIKDFINKVDGVNLQSLFKVAFSETVRDCSWTRNGEFKLYRMAEKQLKDFAPDVFGIMETKLVKLLSGIKSFLSSKKGNAPARVYGFNSVNKIPKEIISDNSVDLVVTSPPYGDSRTTVAYGQFSRLSSEWLDFPEARQVDNNLMGGKRNNGHNIANINNFKVLKDVLNQISDIDSSRVKDVVAFYSDYKKSIDNVASIIKKGGYACYVVGNRKVKGVVLPTDEITISFFKPHGFKHVETIIRNIPNKRMPSKNSPSNVTGKLDSTMTNEYIVVLKKI